jgi:ketosteroid isomerase-like protein
MARHADDIALLEPVRRLRTTLAMAEYSSTHQVSKVLKLAHPLIEVRSVPGIAPGPGYVGHDELRRYFAEAANHEARAAAVIHRAEVTERGNVLAAGELISTTNQANGAISAWFVFRFRDGPISAVESYLDIKTAREQAQRRINGHDLSNTLHPPSQ